MTGKTRHPSVRRRKPQPPVKAASATLPERDLKIGEAAKIVGVETFVLRFWETQFPFLKPKHTRTKHRFYQNRDIEVLRLIKHLLHDEGFTIAGANKHIREAGLDELLARKSKSPAAKGSRQSAAQQSSRENSSSHQSSTLDGPARRVLSELREDLKTIKKLLDN
jgi:DNA-binding transcriptional MerR regulator